MNSLSIMNAYYKEKDKLEKPGQQQLLIANFNTNIQSRLPNILHNNIYFNGVSDLLKRYEILQSTSSKYFF